MTIQSFDMRSAVLFLALSFLPTSALSDCYICDELVHLKKSQAECFLSRYYEFLELVSTAPRGRSSINMNECAGGVIDDPRGGVIDLPEVPSEGYPSELEQPDSKSIYLMDAAGVTCLRRLIESYRGDFAPVAEFDLFEKCQDG